MLNDEKYEKIIHDLKQDQSVIDRIRIATDGAVKREAKKNGCSVGEARKNITSLQNGDLSSSSIVVFEEHGSVPVSDILKDTMKYNNAPCCDPAEPGLGTGKAMFYANVKRNKPLVHSMLHGGCKYFLKKNTTKRANPKPKSKTSVKTAPTMAKDGPGYKPKGSGEGDRRTHAQLGAAFIMEEFPSNPPVVAVDGCYWGYNSKKGVYVMMSADKVEIKIGDKFSGAHCKKGGDYAQVEKNIHKRLSDQGYFASSKYGIPCKSHFYVIDQCHQQQAQEICN